MQLQVLKKIQKPFVWAAGVALVSVVLVPLSHSAGAQQSFYTVQPGDTLTAISALYGTSVDAIAEANGIGDPDLIVVGDSLSIPGTAASTEEQPVWEQDPDAGVGGGQPAYMVQAGDTLGAIADLLGVSVSDLTDVNDIEDPHLIVTGQSLRVPGTTGPAAPAVVSSDDYLSHDELRAMFFDAAAIHGEDPYLMMALAWQESGWQQDVVSYAGAYGIMQVMPATADWAGPALVGWETDYVNSAWDNIQTGVAFYAHLYRESGSDYYALAGYYQGPYSVETQGLFDDTQAYVRNILEMRDLFASGRMP